MPCVKELKESKSNKERIGANQCPSDYFFHVYLHIDRQPTASKTATPKETQFDVVKKRKKLAAPKITQMKNRIFQDCFILSIPS